MLVPFTPTQQKLAKRLHTEYMRNLSILAESIGISEVVGLHPEYLGFLVPDAEALELLTAPQKPNGAPQPPTEQPQIQQ
jgi:hypothetical protein